MENSDNPRKQPLTNPYTKNEVVNRLILGENSKSIAKNYNCAGARIRQIKAEYLPIIEEAKLRLAEKLPKADQILETRLKTALKLSKYENNPTKNKNSTLYQEPEHILKLNSDVSKTIDSIYRNTGISPVQANVFNNPNIQINQEMHPEVLKLILPALAAKIQDVDEK